jgi:hypothetical protein
MSLYIDIAISLVLVFLVFSVVVYVLQELLAINFQYRGKMLWRSLAQVLDGVKFTGKRALDKDGVVGGVGTPITDLFFSICPSAGVGIFWIRRSKIQIRKQRSKMCCCCCWVG